MNDKANIRNKLKEKRIKLSREYIANESKKIITQLITSPLIAKANNIAGYFPANNEVDTKELKIWCWKNNKNYYLPVLRNQSLMFSKYLPSTLMVKNKFKIPEPQNTNVIYANKLEIIIIPLVGTDIKGNRIGMGAGFYDRTLAFKSKCPLLIGLAYDFQVVDFLTPEEFDIPLNYVVTPNKIIICEE